MVLSYYLLKIPYTVIWEVRELLNLNKDVMLYCANALDYQIFTPVQKHLPPLKVIAKDKKAQQELAAIGVKSKVYPVFPKGVIMCRQAGYKFPASRMKKVGMRHGAYTFKPFANTKGYNLLDHFYMTSSREVERAEAVGITCARAVGFPKLDPMFDGSVDDSQLQTLAQNAGLDDNKPTLLFTATWNDSGVSAISHWYDKLAGLTADYNILVTVHPWTKDEIKQTIKNTPQVFFIDTADIVPYIQLADVCIGDTSSVLAECCALEKDMVTFAVDDGKRTVQEVKQLIKEFSIQIDSFDQLQDAIKQALTRPQHLAQARDKANKIMFDQLDGKAGLRAANYLKELFPQLNQTKN